MIHLRLALRPDGPGDRPPVEVAVRAVLKLLLRRFGLRCLKVDWQESDEGS